LTSAIAGKSKPASKWPNLNSPDRACYSGFHSRASFCAWAGYAQDD
jgi:hypothetical protein